MKIKHTLWIAIFICASTFNSNAQVGLTAESFPKNEIKINAPYLIFGFIELSYERILNEQSSVGATIGFSVDEDFYFFKFAFLPYYRLYFSKKPASGFFVEGNAALYRQEKYYSYYPNPKEYDTGVGLGFAIGYKLINANNWFADIYAGLGRNFNDENLEVIYPRLGLNVGKRF